VAADTDQIELEAVVPDGAPDEAIGQMIRQWLSRPTPWVGLVVIVVVSAALIATTGQPAWLPVLLLWPAWVWVGYSHGRHGFQELSLRPGSVIRVSWGTTEVAVRRPAGTVHFQYAGMGIAGRTDLLTMVWVRNVLGSRRRQVLFLPHALVPPEAVKRFSGASPTGPDPFDAAAMERVFRVPERFARPLDTALASLSPVRRWVLAALLAVEVLGLLYLLLTAAWWPLLALLGGLGLWVWVVSRAWSQARHRLPAGAVVGATFAEGKVGLALPDQRLDMPDSRVRNVIVCGADLVLFQFTRTGRRLVPVPRALVPDEDIDRLRVIAGRRPMRARERLSAIRPVGVADDA
jgi:hypothetical protein